MLLKPNCKIVVLILLMAKLPGALTQTLTGCTTVKVLLSSEGTITSPGFPDPPTKDGVCTWTILEEVGNVIQLTFHSIAIGPELGFPVPCSSNMVTAVISLYNGFKVDETFLIARYCTREAQPVTITTIGNYLTMTYTQRNTQILNGNTTYGFNASYVSMTLDDPTAQPLGPFPYGPYSSDHALAKDQKQSPALSFDIFSRLGVGAVYWPNAYVHADGRVSFARNTGSDAESYICVYCSQIDFSNEAAAVYYQLYRCSEAAEPPLERFMCDEIDYQIRTYTAEDFNSTVALVATWFQVESKQGGYAGRATIQIAVVSDFFRTYAIFHYKDMLWNSTEASPDIDIGAQLLYSGTPKYWSMVYSNTKQALRLDTLVGNTGRKGTWIYEIGPIAEDRECEVWYHRNLPLKDRRFQEFTYLPDCPCFRYEAEQNSGWTLSPIRDRQKGVCYRVSSTVSQHFLPYSKLCCYAENSTNATLLTDPPDAGAATAYNPSFPPFLSQYEKEDNYAHYACCEISSSSELCDRFYELRPIATCNPNSPTANYTDECADGTAKCDQVCSNTLGFYKCSCWTGYTLSSDGRTCNDTDECADGTAKCDQVCNNTLSSYKCSCWTGYTLSSDGRTCNDTDECADGTAKCDQVCYNTLSSYKCSCWTGYTLSSDGRTCNDTDECADGTAKCDQVCSNTLSSYKCSCWTGYTLSSDGRTCNDVDECVNDVDYCDQICANTQGSYNCRCQTGYTLDADGKTCQDRDECVNATDGKPCNESDTVTSDPEQRDPSQTNSTSNTVLYIGVGTGAGVVLVTALLILGVCLWRRVRKKDKETKNCESTGGGGSVSAVIPPSPSPACPETGSYDTLNVNEIGLRSPYAEISHYNAVASTPEPNVIEMKERGGPYESLRQGQVGLPSQYDTIKHYETIVETTAEGNPETATGHYESLQKENVGLSSPYTAIAEEKSTGQYETLRKDDVGVSSPYTAIAQI